MVLGRGAGWDADSLQSDLVLGVEVGVGGQDAVQGCNAELAHSEHSGVRRESVVCHAAWTVCYVQRSHHSVLRLHTFASGFRELGQ